MLFYEKVLLSRLPTAQANRSLSVNDVNSGSPSRIRRVLRISLGMTIRPRSSTRLTIPVAFISFPLLAVNSTVVLFAGKARLCGRFQDMERPRSKGKCLIPVFYKTVFNRFVGPLQSGQRHRRYKRSPYILSGSSMKGQNAGV